MTGQLMGTAMGSATPASHMAELTPPPSSRDHGESPPGDTDGCDTSPPAVRNKALEPLSSGIHYVKRVSPKALRRRAIRREARKRLGGRCVLCSATENLEFDHRDPFTRTDQEYEWDGSWAKMEAELPLLQLLCNPCHIEKSRIDRFLKTGTPLYAQCGTTTGYYSRGCRCPECTEAMRRYSRSKKTL